MRFTILIIGNCRFTFYLDLVNTNLMNLAAVAPELSASGHDVIGEFAGAVVTNESIIQAMTMLAVRSSNGRGCSPQIDLHIRDLVLN